MRILLVNVIFEYEKYEVYDTGADLIYVRYGIRISGGKYWLSSIARMSRLERYCWIISISMLDKQHRYGFAISVTMLAFSIIEAIMYIRSSIPIDASSFS